MTAAGSISGGMPALSKDRLRLWLRLLRTTSAIENDLRERLRVEFSTTLPRFDVLAALARDDKCTTQGLSMTALSRQLLVSNGNVTGIVDRLVADGMVQRTVDQTDRRSMAVRLTPQGATAFAAMAAAHARWLDDLLAPLSAADMDLLQAALARLTPRLAQDV